MPFTSPASKDATHKICISGACRVVWIARIAAHMNTVHSEKCAILTTNVNQQRKKLGTFCSAKKFVNLLVLIRNKFEDCVIDMTSLICLEAIQNVKLNMSNCQKLYCNKFSDICPL